MSKPDRRIDVPKKVTPEMAMAILDGMVGGNQKKGVKVENCPICGKRLSSYNRSGKCYACGLPEVP